MRYDILRSELQLSTYAGLSDEAVAGLLNAKTINAKQAIHALDIQKYLMLNDLLLVIENGTSSLALAATRALEIFDSFDTADSQVSAKFMAILDGLVADTTIPGFTEADKTAILAMGDTTISRATELGLPVVEVRHVAEARS